MHLVKHRLCADAFAQKAFTSELSEADAGLVVQHLPKKLCLVKSRGFAHLLALGLISMMSHCVIVIIVELVDLIEMRKTACSGKTRHVPSS